MPHLRMGNFLKIEWLQDAVPPFGAQGSGYRFYLRLILRVISCSFPPRKIGFFLWILEGLIRVKKEYGHLAGDIRNNSHAMLDSSGRGKIRKAHRNFGAGYGSVSPLKPFHQSFRPAPGRFPALSRVPTAIPATQGQCGPRKGAAHVLTETHPGTERRRCLDYLFGDIYEAILLQTEEDRFRSSPTSLVTFRRFPPCFFHPLWLRGPIFYHPFLPMQYEIDDEFVSRRYVEGRWIHEVSIRFRLARKFPAKIQPRNPADPI